jgi:hypothetical protein
MALLQTLELLFVMLNGRFELFDILCTPLSESSLSLAVALLTLFGRRIDLLSQ